MTLTRKEPESHEFDVVVAGGGLAGLCAALAAARNGARTAILQDRPVFGGNSSSEVRVVPYGSTHGAAWGSETGIVHELMLADRAGNHEHFFDHGLMNSVWDLNLAEAARREPNLTTFLNTTVRGVETEALTGQAPYARDVTAVHASQLASEKEFVLAARHFVDATGDGTLGALAGAEQRYGREARAEYDEPLAPRVADEVTLGSTITMRARRTDTSAPYTPPDWVARYTSPDDFVMDRRLYHLEKDSFGGYWWLEVNEPFHQIDDNAGVRDELHRHVLGVWNYLKNHSPERDRFDTFVLDWIGMIPGKRESRRGVGDVTVTEHDCHHDRQWPDGISYASWWIDLHIKGGINNREAPGERENIDTRYSDYIRLAPFSLPLRACYSRNVRNLWMTGRLLSVTHVALGPVRVQVTLAAQGQAVGTAAAWAAELGLTPRATADPDGPHLQPLRQRLLRQDARLLGARNTDPDDLALTAVATASSAQALSMPDPATADPAAVRWLDLDTDRAQVVPLIADRLDAVEVYVRNAGDTPARVPVAIEELHRIWDREHGKPAGSAVLDVPAGHEGWLRVPMQVQVTARRPHRVVLGATAQVAWACVGPLPVGAVAQYLTRSPGGCEERNAHLECFAPDEVDLPAFEHWRQYRKGAHGLRVEPRPRPHEAAEAVTGAAWVEDLPNLWLSRPVGPDAPEWLRLSWPEPVRVGLVQVSFDTDLDLGFGSRPGFHRSARCARRWRLEVGDGVGGWRTVHAEDGNCQRQRVIRLSEPVSAAQLRVVVDEVGRPGEGVGIFEVRVYAPEQPAP